MTTSIKTCFKCGAEKPLTDFYRHKMMGDGRLNKCKECTKQDSRRNRRKKIDHYREYDRKRGNRQSCDYVRGYRAKSPAIYRAHSAVSNALRDGKLVRPRECESCGREAGLHGHHDDYARPLDVRWLCAACHRQWHHENGPGKNADMDPDELNSAA